MAHARLEEIRRMVPRADHVRIAHLIACYEFPWDMTRSLELALFRTFGVPSISALLDRTAQFQNHAQKRYDDTDLIVSEMLEWGYDSERGRAALRRMNQQHGRFAIANADFLYVLSTFIFEPIRWINRFGWRRLTDTEQQGLFHFWREVGRRMGIKDIPERYEDLERYNLDYEQRYYVYSDANHRVGTATLNMFAGWFPGPLQPAVRTAMYSLMDDRLLEAFGFPRPSGFSRRLVWGAMRTRALALRVLPKRRRPRLRTQMRHRTYPNGYTIPTLGPPGT